MRCPRADVYCEYGQIIPVSAGYYTDAGYDTATGQGMRSQSICTSAKYYCTRGVRLVVPNGFYSLAVESLSSTTITGKGHDSILLCTSSEYYCSRTDGIRRKVREGYYSVGGYRNGTGATKEAQCEAGYFCTRGVRIPLRAGEYGVSADSAGRGASGRAICPSVKHYCGADGVKRLVDNGGWYTAGGDEETGLGMTHQIRCDGKRYYCLNNAHPDAGVRRRIPQHSYGTAGSNDGLGNR